MAGWQSRAHLLCRYPGRAWTPEECVPPPLLCFVADQVGAAPDPILLARVQHEGRVLLTMDKGIADVRAYPPQQDAGIILFRLNTMGRGAVLAFVRQHLPTILQMPLTGHLLVVSEIGIRIR